VKRESKGHIISCEENYIYHALTEDKTLLLIKKKKKKTEDKTLKMLKY
jgi:hypothetical protein